MGLYRVRFNYCGGLRIGEVLGLDVGSVDFLRRSLKVEQQFTQDGNLTGPKGGKVRTISVPQALLDSLAAHLAQFPSDEALVTDELGRRLTYRRWKLVWAAAAKKVGFDGSTHDLRHYAASALISGGASVVQVQEVLGHADATITLRTYAHLFPGDEERTRNALDAALSILRSEDNVRTGTASR